MAAFSRKRTISGSSGKNATGGSITKYFKVQQDQPTFTSTQDDGDKESSGESASDDEVLSPGASPPVTQSESASDSSIMVL